MIGQEIKALREKLGLTQEEFARRLGVTASSVSHWERGISKPSRLARQALERIGAAEA